MEWLHYTSVYHHNHHHRHHHHHNHRHHNHQKQGIKFWHNKNGTTFQEVSSAAQLWSNVFLPVSVVCLHGTKKRLILFITVPSSESIGPADLSYSKQDGGLKARRCFCDVQQISALNRFTEKECYICITKSAAYQNQRWITLHKKCVTCVCITKSIYSLSESALKWFYRKKEC